MKLFANLFIIFGILWSLLGGYYFWMKNDPDRLKFQNYKAPVVTTAQAEQIAQYSMPAQIKIKDLNIDLPVIPAKIDNDKWETTQNGASYLLSSPVPGTDGNSIIYAHNWASLFGNLVKAKPGEAVEMTYADGSHKQFIIEYTSTVFPTASTILAPSKDKRITLYTCTGFLDSKRFVVVAVYNPSPSFAAVPRP